jgi:ABC-type glycerol-3-phosphate transport system substrate-binding protein
MVRSNSQKWLGRAALLIVALTMLSLPSSFLRAQDAGITLTLAIPEFAADLITPKLLDEFTASHPGIHVQTVTKDAFLPSPTGGLDAYLKAVNDYVSSADVLSVDGSSLSPTATRGGYFLDLTPLIATDNTLDSADFYPAVWRSFQWDNKTWALPSGASATVLSYRPDAFDKAQIAYPDSKWTVDDFVNAVDKLTQKDANGKVTVPGLTFATRDAAQVLLQSLIGEKLFDDSAVPSLPRLDTPAAEKLAETWYKFDPTGIGGDLNNAPMAISELMFLAFQAQGSEKSLAVALPGGRVGLSTEGYAVSAGTQHPAEAYALAEFLTTRIEAVGFASLSPARKSLSGAPAATGNGERVIRRPPVAPEVQPLLDEALNNGLSAADMPYNEYFINALTQMKANNLSAQAALRAAEAQVLKDQAALVSAKSQLSVVVATPVPVVPLASGKIALKFGLAANIRPYPNQDKWEKLAQEFASSDPEVGRVNIDLPLGSGDLAELADKYDCFFLPYNAVPGANVSKLLNLDPFISADSSFDKNDLVGNILAQLQQDNKTWGYPLMIEPDMLSYDSQAFAKANLPEPQNGWTIDAFVDALKALKSTTEGEPFVPNSPGGTHLLTLMAAFGGLPLDYRTNPPTLNFADPATVEAIRQVLDLAKNGYIKYTKLTNLSGAYSISLMREAPITTQMLRGIRVQIGDSSAPDPYKSVTYPTGSQYNALSYAIDTAYISAKAQNPEACYRWISTVAQHAELFSAMPARRSLALSPATAKTQGADISAQYAQIDKLLSDPHTVSFPSLFQGGASPVGFLLEHWLYEAFDSYVLDNGDLEAALKSAETYAQDFQGCTAAIPPYDPTSAQTADQYRKQYYDCAAKADPRLKDLVKSLN